MCDNWKQKYEVNFTKAEFKKIILTLKLKFRCDYIRFHGQEATLYKDLNDLIEFSKKMKMRVALKTNGWLLTDTRLYKALDIGLDELYLSVDSSESKLHDEIRWIPGSFDKNIDLVKKTREYAPSVWVYFNSVVMRQSYKTLPALLDVCQKYGVMRQSFVFLNDKNRKDIGHVNLSKQEFEDFFKNEIPEIYKKSIQHNIPVDFSPFVSQFVGEKPEKILSMLRSPDEHITYQIDNFYRGIYGQDFYDRYGCQGPIDHASLNYNWDMFGCCVVERDRSNKVWNILKDDLGALWNDSRYKLYRHRSNYSCSYGHKCASNFQTRKSLFQDTYLNEEVFDMNHPYNYYRYIKEIWNETPEVLCERRDKKINLLIEQISKNIPQYEQEVKGASEKFSTEKFSRLSFLSKNKLSELYDFIDNSIKHDESIMKGHTSGSSGFRLDFLAPCNFRRYVKQIAMFSQVSNFWFYDWYYSITPTNCHQTSVNKWELPVYVKKQYIWIEDFTFSREAFDEIRSSFDSRAYKYIYADSKYLLYIILLYKTYSTKLPSIDHIFLSYTHTNRWLKEFINSSFWSPITEIYGCSEVWPIAYSLWETYQIFWDNLIVEEHDWELVVTDLENSFFPFIRYKNGDECKITGNMLEFTWKKWQEITWKSITSIDTIVYKSFPEIIYYQFIGKNFLYYAENTVDKVEVWKLLIEELEKEYIIEELGSHQFFEISPDCWKYKSINI